MSLNSNNHLTYVYDADGNRTLKQTGGSLHLYGGSRRLSGETDTEPFTLYVGPWMTANDRGVYTKHVYAGAERIVSKIVNDSVYFNDDLTVEKAGDGMNPSVDYGRITSALSGRTKAIYDELEIPYRGLSDAERKTTAQSAAGKAEAVARAKAGPETARFFYHPDHLGSSSFITDAEGKVVQHLEYVPYGEVFLDERTGGWNAPYLFNAKELDQETGLYYYGARYYDPRLSLWLSTDPMQENAPESSTYSYCLNRPVIATDPDGNWTFLVPLIKGVISGTVDFGAQITVEMANGKSFTEAFSNVDWTGIGSAALTGAIAAPGISTGAKAAIGAIVITDAAVDVNANGQIKTVFGGPENYKQIEHAAIDMGSALLPVSGVQSMTNAFTKAVTYDLTSKSAATLSKRAKVELGKSLRFVKSEGFKTGAGSVSNYIKGISTGQLKTITKIQSNYTRNKKMGVNSNTHHTAPTDAIKARTPVIRKHNGSN